MIRELDGKFYVSEDTFKTLMVTRGWGTFVDTFISVTYKKMLELSSDPDILFCDVESIEPEEVRDGIRSDLEDITAKYTKYQTINKGETHE